MGRPEMSCPWTLLTERDVPKTYIPLKTVSLMLIILVYTCPCVILSQLYRIPQQFYPNVICAEGPKKSGLSVTALECKDDIIPLIISSRIFYVFEQISFEYTTTLPNVKAVPKNTTTCLLFTNE